MQCSCSLYLAPLAFALLLCSGINLYSQENNGVALPVKSISIKGNGVTRNETIIRELTFQVGDSIAPDEISRNQRRSKENLDKSRLFNFVTITPHIDSTGIAWDVNVEERWYIWPFPIFEYADRNLSSFLKNGNYTRLNYGGYLVVENFLGIRDEIRVRAVLGHRKQLGFKYITHNLDDAKRHGLSVEANYYSIQEVLYKNINNKPVYFKSLDDPSRNLLVATLSYYYRPRHNWFHGLSVSNVKATISDTVSILNPNYFGEAKSNFKFAEVTYQLTLDKRNSRVFPLSGHYLRVGVSRKGILKTDDLNLWQLTLNGSYFTEINKKLFAGFDALAKISSKNNLPFFASEAIGYRDFIRGFEHYITNGSSYVINKNSLKFELLAPKVFNLPIVPDGKFKKAHVAFYWSLFADTGYIKPDALSPQPNLEGKFIYGYGTGLYMVAYYDIVFRVEYSFNMMGESGLFFHFGTPFLINYN